MHHHSTFAPRSAFVATLLCVAVALPACAGASQPVPADPPSVIAQRPAMVPVAPRKANGSGIEVQYRIEGVARLGEALPIALSFHGISDPAGASVRFTVDAGLTLPPAYASELALQGGPAAPTMTVPVTPTAEGLAYLHVFATQNGATSVSSVAVQVGKAVSLKLRGDLKSTPSGDRILTIPVP